MPPHLVIVGNGIAGITAARFVRKRSNAQITVVSDESDHHYARTALMYVYMGHLRRKDLKPYEDWFWPKHRIGLRRAFAEGVDVAGRRLLLRGGDALGYDRLLIACGSRPRYGGWPGERLGGVQGLYGLPDLEAMERATGHARRAVVVGGGLIGIELVEMLHARHIPVTFLVREPRYLGAVLPPEESALLHDEITRHGVALRLGTGLAALHDDGAGRVGAATTAAGETLPADFVGLAIGVEPNVGWLRTSDVELGRGVLVDEAFATSAPDVWAVGDCAEFRDPSLGYRPVEQLWYTARRHGMTVAHTLTGERRAYRRGVFFNSAKFFTVEYQTYGRVPPGAVAGEEALVWQDRARRRLLRLHYRRRDGAVLGFNALGVRLRQDVCSAWIAAALPVSAVVARLGEALFDPELARRPLFRPAYAGLPPA